MPFARAIPISSGIRRRQGCPLRVWCGGFFYGVLEMGIARAHRWAQACIRVLIAWSRTLSAQSHRWSGRRKLVFAGVVMRQTDAQNRRRRSLVTAQFAVPTFKFLTTCRAD
ncbi:MAG: hypothetical protein OES26_25285 [Gammaproteobacteria bacterium]|nr:hypothetical protein [Gammaproteobacteria bacterium]